MIHRTVSTTISGVAVLQIRTVLVSIPSFSVFYGVCCNEGRIDWQRLATKVITGSMIILLNLCPHARLMTRPSSRKHYVRSSDFRPKDLHSTWGFNNEYRVEILWISNVSLLCDTSESSSDRSVRNILNVYSSTAAKWMAVSLNKTTVMILRTSVTPFFSFFRFRCSLSLVHMLSVDGTDALTME